MTFATVPRSWPGATVVCVGTGPSLKREDLDSCRGKVHMIVVNDAYKWAQWADVMYACDAKWWNWEKGAPSFQGVKYTLESKAERRQASWPGVETLRNFGRTGLSLDPAGLKTGSDSGYQAINLAVLFGAVRILLLGYDMRVEGKKDHYFGSHPDKTKPSFTKCLDAYRTLVAPLRAAGVTVINCSPKTALTCFPMAPLRDVLAERAA